MAKNHKLFRRGPRQRSKSFLLLFFKKEVLACFLTISAAQAECTKHRAAEVPLTLWQEKLYVPVAIDGVQRMMFLDTGAAVTTLSVATANALNLPRDFDHTADTFGVGGMESHLYIVQTRSLSLGGITVAGRQFPTAVFAGVMADDTTPIGGLIGADILSRFDLDIDIPRRRLGLWQVSGCTDITPDWPGRIGSVPIDIEPSRHVSVPVTIDGTAVDLLLDTGSPGLVLSTRAAARAGATPEMLEDSRTLQGRGVNERAFSAWLHIIRRLEIAGEVFGDARAVVVSNGRVMTGDGLLGLAFLKRGRVWLSYATGRLFVEQVASK